MFGVGEMKFRPLARMRKPDLKPKKKRIRKSKRKKMKKMTLNSKGRHGRSNLPYWRSLISLTWNSSETRRRREAS